MAVDVVRGRVAEPARGPVRRRRPAGAALVAALLLVPACSADEPSGGGGNTPEEPPVAVTTATVAPEVVDVQAVPVGRGPVGLAWIADGDGSIWVAEARDGTVTRLRGDVRRSRQSVDVGETPLRLVVDGERLWATTFGDGGLVEIDPDALRVRQRVEVGEEPEGVAAADGALWVVLQADALLARVVDGEVAGTTRIGVSPRQVTAGLGAVWVSDFVGDMVLRIDGAGEEPTLLREVCEGPQGMVADDASEQLWVTCTSSDEVIALDPGTGKVSRRITGLTDPDGLALDPAGRLLVTLQEGPAVAVVDTGTGEVTHVLVLGDAPPLRDRANIDLLVLGDQVLVSSFLTDEVLLTTLPQTSPASGDAG